MRKKKGSFFFSVAGSLNVYLDDTANTTHTLLWSQSGNQGNSWLQGQMPIPTQAKEYQVSRTAEWCRNRDSLTVGKLSTTYDSRVTLLL